MAVKSYLDQCIEQSTNQITEAAIKETTRVLTQLKDQYEGVKKEEANADAVLKQMREDLDKKASEMGNLYARIADALSQTASALKEREKQGADETLASAKVKETLDALAKLRDHQSAMVERLIDEQQKQAK